MIRYLRLYGYFLRFSFSRALQFRLDFYFRIIMDVIYYVVNILFFKIIFLHTSALAGWTQPQVMIFVGAFIVIDAVNMTVFSNNIWALPSLINRGDLDYYIVRPISSFFFVSLRDFAANSFINLIIAAGILIGALVQYPEPISPLKLLAFLLMILNGNILYFLTRMIFILPVFWTHSSRGLDMMFFGLTKFMERPRQIFKGALKIVLLTILPFSLMASVPAEILFASNPWILIAWCLSGTFVFLVVILSIWRMGLRSYSSASS